MKRFHIKLLFFIFLLVTFFNCTEEYELKTKNFESLIVVEATLTNELQTQEVKLSKTFRLESGEPIIVSNAEVYIQTDTNEQYHFEHTEEGNYTSINPFQAQSGKSYTLYINLPDGSKYVSTSEVLPPVTSIESLNTVLETVNGEQMVVVFANSGDNLDGATFFKYEYEETYKIETPYYSPLDLVMINVVYGENVFLEAELDFYYELELVPKPENVRICYTTKTSTDIIQTSLNDSQNNSVVNFPVRSIRSNDPIIRERYSILVKQYVQSLEAYNFYRVLKELGTIENLFTDNQPGYIQGNMSAEHNTEENVIGFFQVSSISSKRIFFNHGDFGLPLPPYFYQCEILENVDYNDFTWEDGDRDDYTLIYNSLYTGSYKYFEGFHPVYTLVSAKCGDCSLFSSTLIPEFWED